MISDVKVVIEKLKILLLKSSAVLFLKNWRSLTYLLRAVSASIDLKIQTFNWKNILLVVPINIIASAETPIPLDDSETMDS